jgi:hypothetical protein
VLFEKSPEIERFQDFFFVYALQMLCHCVQHRKRIFSETLSTLFTTLITMILLSPSGDVQFPHEQMPR